MFWDRSNANKPLKSVPPKLQRNTNIDACSLQAIKMWLTIHYPSFDTAESEVNSRTWKRKKEKGKVRFVAS